MYSKINYFKKIANNLQHLNIKRRDGQVYKSNIGELLPQVNHRANDNVYFALKLLLQWSLLKEKSQV